MRCNAGNVMAVERDRSGARGRPNTDIISVDLPAPLEPIRATISPGLMSRSTP
jgi:hypothetical protein